MPIRPKGSVMMQVMGKFGQWLIDRLIATPDGSFSCRCLRRLRRGVVAISDPVVSIPLGNTKLLAPLCHNLPLYQKQHPLYDSVLRRFVDFLAGQEAPPNIIDVGANIGDTAVALVHGNESRVLCVEGGEKFLGLLDRNRFAYSDRVRVERCFLGRKSKTVNGLLHSFAGTASLQSSRTGDSVEILSLVEVLTRWPEFASARILKVDTDGYDCEVLRGAMEWIAKLRPIIFMEFYPRLLEAVSGDYMEVFDLLVAAGYDLVLYYANTGEYISGGRLSDGIAADIASLTHKSYGPVYYDLFLFHRDDDLLGARFRVQERLFHERSGVKDRVNAV
jgi:FkbM family methyltransferase